MVVSQLGPFLLATTLKRVNISPVASCPNISSLMVLKRVNVSLVPSVQHMVLKRLNVSLVAIFQHIQFHGTEKAQYFTGC